MLYNRKKILALALLVCLVGISTACPMTGKTDSRTRTLAKATDDFAEGQKSAANLFATAKANGTISQEEINEIKPFLVQANELNAQAIELGKKLIASPDDPAVKDQLVTTINLVSAALVRANNAGLLKIKDQKLRIAFSTVVVALQAATTSAITVLRN